MPHSNLANDNIAVLGSVSNLPFSKGESRSSHQLRETQQYLEMAAQMATPIYQGNVASFDVQRKSPMPNSDELVDSKLEAAEARTDTKIARLEGKIDVLTATIVAKIDSLKDNVTTSHQYNRDTRLVVLSTFIVGFLALAGLFVALATYGDALFGRGMSVRDVVQAVIKEQQEIQKRDTTLQPRR
jgi:hypothetical protein